MRVEARHPGDRRGQCHGGSWCHSVQCPAVRRLKLSAGFEALLCRQPCAGQAINLPGVVPPPEGGKRVDHQRGPVLAYGSGGKLVAEQADHVIEMTLTRLDRGESLDGRPSLLRHVPPDPRPPTSASGGPVHSASACLNTVPARARSRPSRAARASITRCLNRCQSTESASTTSRYRDCRDSSAASVAAS